MSVINETLDNLKQAKKRTVKSLNPSSSSYAESTVEKAAGTFKFDKSFVIPLGAAVLVGIFVSMYHMKQSSSPTEIANNNAQPKAEFFHHVKNALKSSDKTQAQIQNPLAQSQYYIAMTLLNDGKEDQAIVHLKEIVEKYPDFIPAQNVYSMLIHH